MKEDDLRVLAEYYDHIYRKRKNYENESKIIREIIAKFENIRSNTLLDVGCGTGEHLKYLSRDFQCAGVDVNKRMIEIARNKVPRARFEVAGMVNLSLKSKFDTIICLFSSIGYVQNFDNLIRTVEGFRDHLTDRGIVIVEPWVFKKDYKKGIMPLDTFEDENIKLARMGTSKIGKSEWMVFMHYLVGRKGETNYVKELHKMALLNYGDYIKAFKLARFGDVKFLKDG